MQVSIFGAGGGSGRGELPSHGLVDRETFLETEMSTKRILTHTKLEKLTS